MHHIFFHNLPKRAAMTAESLSRLPWHDSTVEALRHDQEAQTVILIVTLCDLPNAAEALPVRGILVFQGVRSVEGSPPLPAFEANSGIDGEILRLSWTLDPQRAEEPAVSLVMQVWRNQNYDSIIAVTIGYTQVYWLPIPVQQDV